MATRSNVLNDKCLPPNMKVNVFLNNLIEQCSKRGIITDFTDATPIPVDAKNLRSIEEALLVAIKSFPENSVISIGTFVYQDRSYLTVSMPVIDAFDNPWSKYNLMLSHAFSLLGNHVDYDIRPRAKGADYERMLRIKVN